MPRRPDPLAAGREAIRILESRPRPRSLVRPAGPPLATRFVAFDDRLSALGVPPCTAWWRDGISRWLDAYERHHVLELFANVGRGGAKSTALYKLALFFTLEGDFPVPIGERHYAIVLSRLKEEASKGVAIIDRWLTLLGVPHHPAGDVVDLDDRPRGIRVVAASVAATSGWRAYFVAKDERAKWRVASDSDDQEADEIDTSAAAMTATHALAPVLSSSSSWVTHGSFYDRICRGSDDTAIVLGPAPTWVVAPHITEESTRKKEPNERKWRREYGCEWQEEHEDGMFSAALLDVAARADACDLPYEPGVTYVAAMDVGFVRNAWTFCIAALRRVGGKLRRSVVLTREWQGSPEKPLDPERVLREIAPICRTYRVTTIEGDSYERFSLQSIAARPEIRLFLNTYDHGSIETRAEALLTWLTDGSVELPSLATVRKDILAVRQRFNRTGYSVSLPVTPDGRHCDWVPTLTIALAACVTPPDERAQMTPEERIEAEAVRMDEEAWGTSEEHAPGDPFAPHPAAGRSAQPKPYRNSRQNRSRAAKPYWNTNPVDALAWQPSPYERRRRG